MRGKGSPCILMSRLMVPIDVRTAAETLRLELINIQRSIVHIFCAVVAKLVRSIWGVRAVSLCLKDDALLALSDSLFSECLLLSASNEKLRVSKKQNTRGVG